MLEMSFLIHFWVLGRLQSRQSSTIGYLLGSIGTKNTLRSRGNAKKSLNVANFRCARQVHRCADLG